MNTWKDQLEATAQAEPRITEEQADQWEGWVLALDLVCCDKATRIHCVCIRAFTCPDHGERHHGTHD